MSAQLLGDVERILSFDELPASVREIPANHDPLADGVLMLHQQEAIALCHQEDLVVFEKGRRTGITYAIALDSAIIAASSKEAGGDNVYYVGDTKDKGLEFIGYCGHFSRVMATAMADGFMGVEVFLFEDRQPNGESKFITSYRIRYASGRQIVALSSNPANIRGLQGIVIIDEAAFHANVQAVIDACLALLIWGGKIRIISTHNGQKNPFNQLIKDARDGVNLFKPYRCTFDDAVKNGLYERVCLMRGWTPSEEGKRAWYNKVRGSYGANTAAMLEELDAIPREGSGVAIPSIVIESCMHEVRPIVRLTLDTDFALLPGDERRRRCEEWIRTNVDPLLDGLDPTLEHCFGSDYARHFDFAIFSPVVVLQDLTRKYPWMIEMLNVPTRQQEQIIWHVIRRLPRFRCGAMDATGNGATLAEYTADEFDHSRTGRIIEVKFNDAWYRDNMQSFVDAWFDKAIDAPKDLDIKNDLRCLERINGIVKLPDVRVKDSKDSEAKRHGDAGISMALGWFASKQDVRDTTVLSAMPRQSTSMYRGY
ncbi:MAG: hypothetical protein AB7U29_17705 [Desulfobulbus sp.]